MRYLHKVMSLPTEADLNALGSEGWRVSAAVGDRVVLVKRVDEPEGAVRRCDTCASFPETEKESDPGKCPEWGLLMEPGGTCGKWASRDAEKSVPDEVSAWHWQARTEIGEKRIEAITSQESGAVAPEHKHRALVIRDAEGNVVRGKTDVVNDHDHAIVHMGMAEESDGHTHTFLLPQEA
jgi:hypothetical protein